MILYHSLIPEVKMIPQEKGERFRGWCCWNFFLTSHENRIEIRKRQKQDLELKRQTFRSFKGNKYEKQESIQPSAALHRFKATVSTTAQKNKLEVERNSVAQQTEVKKMAPKLAACSTIVQVVVNHPAVKMERETTEVVLVVPYVCVCV